MVAFFSSRIFTPGAAPRRASVLTARRVHRRRSIHLAAAHLAAAAARVAGTAFEILFFVWTLLAVAFSLLVVAGFFA